MQSHRLPRQSHACGGANQSRGSLTIPGVLLEHLKDLYPEEPQAQAIVDAAPLQSITLTPSSSRTGSDGAGKVGSETIDYGGVHNVLAALGSRKARVALMTAIGVTNRTGSYNRSTESHDWKRRAERLVRASGCPYTIVRPGWFDYNKADEHKLVFLQGDTRQAGNSSDGVIARRQIAEVLVGSLTSDHALWKTFELVATKGPAQKNLDELFASLAPDPANRFDGVRDTPNQPLEQEPQRVKDDLHALSIGQR